MAACNLSEFELISWIQDRVGSSSSLRYGIGDDCAVQLQQAETELLTTTDLLIEDVHFKRRWTSMLDLGHKAAAVNLSDIAAMGGVPTALFLGVGRPGDLDDQQLLDMVSGFIAEAKQYGAVLAGGDTCASPSGLMLSVTAQGWVPAGQAIYRSGAGAGESIYVSGSLGDSALALSCLQAEVPVDANLASRFHRPTPRVALGRTLAEARLVTSMLDVSDGLLADLGHILKASKVGAELELDSIPLSQAFRSALADDPSLIDLALSGGEDYELVFTSPDRDLAKRSDLLPGVTRIGQTFQEDGVQIRQRDGSLYHCRSQGFDHFG